MSNFPLAYKLSWLPRLLMPSLDGDREGLLPIEGTLLSPAPKATKRLVFLGDISAVANRSAPEIDTRLRALIASADLVIGNCESPVVEKPRLPFGTLVGTRHAMTADFLSGTIAAMGVSPQRLLLSLANNHMLDQGIEGYHETRAALAGLGIRTVGSTEDGLVRTLDIGGLSIAFAAFTLWRNESRESFDGRVSMLDDIARNDFAVLRSAQADLLCALPHWDYEFRHFPQPATRALARRFANAGTGLIVGGHAHVLQPAERVGSTLVAYGLGDFLGTALPWVRWPLKIGAILVVEISADLSSMGHVVAYRFVPFLRERIDGNERLTPFDMAQGGLVTRIRERVVSIFPNAATARP